MNIRIAYYRISVYTIGLFVECVCDVTYVNMGFVKLK